MKTVLYHQPMHVGWLLNSFGITKQEIEEIHLAVQIATKLTISSPW